MNKNQEYVTFLKEQLLSVKDLSVLLESPNPLKVAKVLARCLKQYFLINGETLYLYEYEYITYHVIRQPTIPYLTMICRKLVVDSFESLTRKQKDSFKDSNIDFYYSMSMYSDLILDIINMITDHTICFDKYLTIGEAHYTNGYTKNGGFFQRDPCVHFISQYYNHEYEVPPMKMKKVASPMDSDSDREEEEPEIEDEKDVKKMQFSKKEIRRIASLI